MMADMKQYKRRGHDIHEVRPDGNLGKRVGGGGDFAETVVKITALRGEEIRKAHIIPGNTRHQARPGLE